VSEELRLNQFRRHGRAIQRDERVFSPQAIFHGSRAPPAPFLCAVSPRNADARLARGDTIDLRNQLLHRRTRTDLARVFPGDGAVRGFHLRAATKPQRIFHPFTSSLSVKGASPENRGRPAFVAFTAISIFACPEMSTTGSLHAGLLQILEQFEAAPAGHDHVGEYHVERFRSEEFDRTSRVVTNGRFMTRQPEGAGERGQRIGNRSSTMRR